MKIAFDLTPLYDHMTGIEKYNLHISKEIILNHPESQYILIFKNEIHNEFISLTNQSNIETVIIPECTKLLFIQYRLYKVLQKIDADIFVFLSFTSPFFFKKGKIINAIHDLTCWDCPESLPIKMKYYYRLAYHAAIRNSWKLITVSLFSQRRICEKYKLPSQEVILIYPGLAERFLHTSVSNSVLHKKYDLPDRYILCLATLEPRKNTQLLIKAYKELSRDGFDLPDLVLAGRRGWNLDLILSEITDNIRQRIHLTGFIDDDDLPQLYREAELFIFPSKYEGFGSPVIEAMSQGTIVITSDAASLPEAGGGAGILFHSNDVDDLKAAIISFYSLGKNSKMEKTNNGIMISRKYSWQSSAEKLYEIMDNSRK